VRAVAVLLLVVTACSSSSPSEGDCDQIAIDIRDAAEKQTPPISPDGICASTDPAILRAFGAACAKLEACGVVP
jgi:hypothetical protein